MLKTFESSTDLQSGPDSGRLRTVKALQALVRDRTEADRRLLHSACLEYLGADTAPAKQQHAIEALLRFVAVRNAAVNSSDSPGWAVGEPSRPKYEKFRSEQPDPRDWPSSKSIRNAFDGDFNAALGAIGERAVIDVAARRVTAQGPAFTREKILWVLRKWKDVVDQTEGPPIALFGPSHRFIKNLALACHIH